MTSVEKNMTFRIRTTILFLLMPLLTFANNPATPVDLACIAPSNWFPKTPQPMNFVANTDCEFQQWSWQEFLWLTQFTDQSPTVRNFETLASPSDLFVASPQPYPGRVGQSIRMAPRFLKPQPETMTATAQAGTADVLVDQNGNLVYYTAMVNEMYYNFITSHHLNLMPNVVRADPNLNFPTHGVGALELKASWRIVSKGGKTYINNPQDFITIPAKIEDWEFDSVKKVWVDNKRLIDATMAMVGMHVVGTVPNHPEFIWATFEHIDNAPTCAATTGNKVGKTNPATGNPWSFYPGDLDCGSGVPCNQGTTITKDKDIKTSVCLLVPEGGGTPASQKIVQSINASVLANLTPHDVRRNYYLGGSVWTTNGTIPPPLAPSNSGGTMQTVITGSTSVENTTMETFNQLEGNNCFGCHNLTNPPLPGSKNIYVSHLLQFAVPLPAHKTAPGKK